MGPESVEVTDGFIFDLVFVAFYKKQKGIKPKRFVSN
jgi:hypothetical protein